MLLHTTNSNSHELLSNSFRRTPNGLIFTDDLKTIYSVFIICLNLTNENNDGNRLFHNVFNKTYPFSFSLSTAVEKMKHLELNAESNTTCISVSYSIKENLARYLLTIFMEGKLLHTPADRTRNEPKQRVFLQPTPKGIAILTKYAKDIGLKKIPEILLSPLNSMTLFIFERSSITDSLIHSDKLLHILLILMMGKSPNIWSPSSKADKLPILSELLECSTDLFTFENFNGNIFNSDVKTESHNETISWPEQISDVILYDVKRESPLAHKFFTNPDSDSHVQYYTSDTGLRLFYEKSFPDIKRSVEYTFTSKVLWQWIMDCTDILYTKEAISLSALFLKAGLIIPIYTKSSMMKRGKFCISRSAYYTLSRSGWEIINWETTKKARTHSELYGRGQARSSFSSMETTYCNPNDCYSKELKCDTVSQEDLSQKTLITTEGKCFENLDEILVDPGMRYLFRKHLEKEFCAENLDVYIEIKKFLKRMTVLSRLIDSKNGKVTSILSEKNSITSTINSALMKQASECLELAFHIYSGYIMTGAPYQLNIDHFLREKITSIITHPQTPMKEAFLSEIKDPLRQSLLRKKMESNFNALMNSPNNHVLTENPTYFLNNEVPKRLSRLNKPTDLTIETETETAKENNRESKITKAHINDPHKSDSVNTIPQTLGILKKLYPLFEQVRVHIYRLMQNDSLQKFNNGANIDDNIDLKRI